jgi:hypothetical protein
MRCTFVIAGLLGLIFVSCSAFAQDARIPQAAQGVWKAVNAMARP